MKSHSFSLNLLFGLKEQEKKKERNYIINNNNNNKDKQNKTKSKSSNEYIHFSLCPAQCVYESHGIQFCPCTRVCILRGPPSLFCSLLFCSALLYKRPAHSDAQTPNVTVFPPSDGYIYVHWFRKQLPLPLLTCMEINRSTSYLNRVHWLHRLSFFVEFISAF